MILLTDNVYNVIHKLAHSNLVKNRFSKNIPNILLNFVKVKVICIKVLKPLGRQDINLCSCLGKETKRVGEWMLSCL